MTESILERSRTSGSSNDFDHDWRLALESDDSRYLIYPSQSSGRQADLFEWIKVQQVLAILDSYRFHEASILEYGCGAAGISSYLAAQGYLNHLCDRSPLALHIAQRNRDIHAPEVGFSSVTVADARRFPFADDYFDVVMSFGLLEHFEPEPLDRLLCETIRLLKPGGLFIADIIPGPKRYNARTMGMVASYSGSLIAHLLTGRWREVKTLRRRYFDHYYENAIDDKTWSEMLRKHDLTNVVVDVCRPFPPLSLSGSFERVYTKLVLHFLPLHQRFDGSNNWFTRRWGWMYLASGLKKEVTSG